jgi:hypothetical protein
MISYPVPFTSQVLMDGLKPTNLVQLAALDAVTQHCAFSPEKRALEANDLHEHWGAEPEPAPLPLPEPDPVSLHSSTTSTKDPALTRSTSTHAGNLPAVPRFSTGRPPDLQLRLVDRPATYLAPHTDVLDNSRVCSPPHLLLPKLKRLTPAQLPTLPKWRLPLSPRRLQVHQRVPIPQPALQISMALPRQHTTPTATRSPRSRLQHLSLETRALCRVYSISRSLTRLREPRELPQHLHRLPKLALHRLPR